MARRTRKPTPDDGKVERLVALSPGRAQMAMTTPKRTATVSSSALRQIAKDGPEQKRARRNRAQTERVWQREAFDYADKVGELGALLTLQSNIVSLCGFPVRRWDDDENDWVANEPDVDDADGVPPLNELHPPPVPGQPPTPPSKPATPAKAKKKKPQYDDRPANVMRNFVGPDGGSVDLIRRAAYNLFCAGDGTLLGTPHPKDTGILWEFLSVLELYPNPDGALVRRKGGVGSTEDRLPDDNYTARLYRSDIAFSDLASSEVKRVLPILQEIVTLTMMIDAIAKSRVPADLLYIPENFSFAGSHTEPVADDPTVDQPDDTDDTDDLVDDLFDHMTAPFNDPGSAARLVPLVIVGPLGPSGRSGIEVIKLSRDFDQFAQELRAEALGRLANGLDAPPEAMIGKSSLSHWTAANVDSEFIVKHIQPIGILIADFITWGYLRPMLEAFEDMSPEDSIKFKVEFDPSPVIARADEAKSARDLSDWLSDDAILMANGFTKADMASAEVIRHRRLWTLISTQPGQFGKLLTLLPGFEAVDPEMIGRTMSANLGPTGPVDASAKAAELADPAKTAAKAAKDAKDAKAAKGGKAIPNDTKEKSTGNETPKASNRPGQRSEPKALAASAGEDGSMAILVERLAVASDAAVARTLERSGSKVISLAQSKAPELRDRLRAARKDRVMSLCTGGELAALGQNPKKLCSGAWDDLALQAREWVRSHLIDQGLDELAADDRAALTAHHLCERVGQLTEGSMLRSWRAGSNGLRVPHQLVTEVLEQAAYAGAL